MSDHPATGGALLAHSLKQVGVDLIFGMGGFQLLPMYDAVRRVGIRHVLINDERSGAFAADAYARASGRIGSCDATLGPGATNLVTGLVEALNAGTPLIALTGNTHRTFSGRNMTQEGRQIEILRPACKELLRVEAVERIPELVRRAADVAVSGRPGPVVIDVPEDVAHTALESATHPTLAQARAVRTAPSPESIERAAKLLARASRPVILAGGGVHISGAYDALDRLARRHQIPVAHTMSGKGSVACTDALSLGLFGRYSRTANDAIGAADCLIAIGCKLGEIATRRYDLLPVGVPIVQIDILAEEIGRTTDIAVPVWADATLALEALDAALPQPEGRPDYLGELERRRGKWFGEVRARLESDEQPISVARLVHEMNLVLPAEATLIADGGFAAHWTALLYDTKRAGRAYIADRGFASIGYGLPGAIGAAFVDRASPVVALTGDGGFNMSLGELETAVREALPLTVVIVNNAASGYVKALQHAMFGGEYESADLAEIDYAAVARAIGAGGIRVTEPGALGAALREALSENRPTVIDVVVTRDPAKMLPGVDSRTRPIKAGDRVA